MDFVKTTEQDSLYSDLEKKDTLEILQDINKEDQKVALAVQKAIPYINPLVDIIVKNMKSGGRLFYLGAGTSGRLGILDASECPPTFGVPHDLVIGLIAGGDSAIRKAVEFAEDSSSQGWKDLEFYNISQKDVVIGIAASGTTPYVLGALKTCNEHGIVTGGLGCNHNSPLSRIAQFPIEVIVGPEYVTGSSRMKAGTAQKMVLNMITTSVMIQLGRVKGNKMVDMQLSNTKLVNRGIAMLMTTLNISKEEASSLLEQYGSVRSSLENYNNGRN
ncbi:N-acetylmuramic acid 6-phosphate etherase [Winogradskyella aurantiaca]|uniref:N-acetylmuramic acid 6-phosphate etherase n=1 Tax=Winogradskyella aurantiaca TaxID=2219558 RepID=UPI000E1DCDB7|nr:N-acetylmuramic acid 6-phosphate etherase [Winogradskyella aurantiaca]